MFRCVHSAHLGQLLPSVLDRAIFASLSRQQGKNQLSRLSVHLVHFEQTGYADLAPELNLQTLSMVTHTKEAVCLTPSGYGVDVNSRDLQSVRRPILSTSIVIHRT
jgi:hypothetical protein